MDCETLLGELMMIQVSGKGRKPNSTGVRPGCVKVGTTCILRSGNPVVRSARFTSHYHGIIRVYRKHLQSKLVIDLKYV